MADADNDVGYNDHTEQLASDYSIRFQVVAEGRYRLRVDSTIAGDLNLVDDEGGFGNEASALIEDVIGTTSGGQLARGSLSLATATVVGGDPTPPNDGRHSWSVAIAANASARISGTTRAAVDHTLRFTWSQHAETIANTSLDFAAHGLEAAVRLGGTSQNTQESASNYPGSPARTEANDGHFVTVQLIPPNDECPDATVVSSTPFHDTQDTSGADSVLSSGLVGQLPVDPALSCGSSSDPNGGHSVWYRFTAPAAGRVTADTAGSDYDTVLSVLTGECASLSEQVCNDNADRLMTTSQVSFPASAGITYYFIVMGFERREAGTLQFGLDFAPPTLTPTRTPTPTPTPSPSRTPRVCVGDCDHRGAVTTNELITMVNVALGNADISACGAEGANSNGQITVDEILTAVNNARTRCP